MTTHSDEHPNTIASGSDRRSMLKRLGMGGLVAAGVASLGGAHMAEGKGSGTDVITNVVDNTAIELPVRNQKDAQLACGVVIAVNGLLGTLTFTCAAGQRAATRPCMLHIRLAQSWQRNAGGQTMPTTGEHARFVFRVECY